MTLPETTTKAHDEAFRRCRAIVAKLDPLLRKLHSDASLLQPESLDGREWFELLRQKLIPQLGSSSWLVAAVVGGTNIGKSVVFNHLAGFRASASSPLASGTRHSVCLVPEGFSEQSTLESIFPDFELHRWDNADEALQEADRHLLFWRTSNQLPDNLLLLDTPDIDSDAKVNWVRADAVRRSADVLVAVLTQQKYNDAAVKQFFRQAAGEDKTVMIVFNQCLLPDDEPYWPVWIKTFCDETGLNPAGVYVVPSDRAAAESLALPFYERPWPVNEGWSAADAQSDPECGVNHRLSDELADLRFQEIKFRSLRGSLREITDERRGIPSFLRELSSAGEELADAAARLSSDSVLRIRDWPSLPTPLLVSEVRSWWRNHQHGWAKRVNSVYDVVGSGVLWPFRMTKRMVSGPPEPPLDLYREREWGAVLHTVEELFDKLEWMAESGNRLIQPRVNAILEGTSRTQLVDQLRRDHVQVKIDDELTDTVAGEMEKFQSDSPDMFKIYRQLNNVSAVVRPATSVVLFSLGFGPAGEAVAPFVADAAAQAVVHVVADVAGGATAAVAGEAAVSGAAGTSVGFLQTWFHNLHANFVARRVEWLTERLKSNLLGSLTDEVATAAGVAKTEEYRQVGEFVRQIRAITDGELTE